MTVQPPLSSQPHQPIPPAQTPLPAQSARRRAARWPFWVGFLAGFALLTHASLVLLWFALGFNSDTLAQIRGQGENWTPPTLVPTATPAPVVEGSEGAIVAGGRFRPNQTVRNVTASRVNLRRSPGHLGKGGDDILGQLATGDSVIILGESAVADNLTWWRVQWQGQEGWVAEATASGVQILGE